MNKNPTPNTPNTSPDRIPSQGSDIERKDQEKKHTQQDVEKSGQTSPQKPGQSVKDQNKQSSR